MKRARAVLHPASPRASVSLSLTPVHPAPPSVLHPTSPCASVSLSPPSTPHHRPSCTLPRPAPLSVSLTPVHPASPPILHPASPRTFLCLSHPRPSRTTVCPAPCLAPRRCLSLTPVHRTPPSVLHAASPRASPWSSLLPGARLLMPWAPLLRSLRGPPCLYALLRSHRAQTLYCTPPLLGPPALQAEGRGPGRRRC